LRRLFTRKCDTADKQESMMDTPAAADQTCILDSGSQGSKGPGSIGHVSADDEVTRNWRTCLAAGLEMMKQRAGSAQITIKRGDRLWLCWLAASTTRALQIGESTLLPNGCNNIVCGFVPRLLGCFAWLLACWRLLFCRSYLS